MPKNVQPREIERIVTYGNPAKFFFQGILIGAAIGGTLALLYAPARGSETREFLKDKAGDAARLVKNKAEDYRERASEVAEDVRITAAETRARGEAELRGVKESRT
jgi:gas vesicle protein